MAGQDLGINIKTSSDVPQAMEKAKSATVSFAKQTEDIQKKFSTAFKDIFLGFVAPMVIVQNVLGAISSAMEKAKQDAKEGLDLLAKGETIYASDEEKKAAAFFKAKKAREDEMELVRKGRAELTRQFMDTKEGSEIANQMAASKGIYDPEGQALYFKMLAHDVEFQKKALEAFINSPEGKMYQPIFEEKDGKKAGTFKGPEGFSSVVGVGANPVLEKMTRQNEIMEEIKLILQEQFILNRGGQVPQPFTERVPLTMQKAGLT